MWHDVIIGSGNSGCSSRCMTNIPGEHSISENNASYWIPNVYLGLGMTIFKDTEEGARITQLVKEGSDAEKILGFATDALLRNINRDKLKKAISNAMAKSFSAGAESKALEIRSSLGI